MQIRNITMADIRAGKNWRLEPSDDDRWFDAPIEQWGPLIETDQFAAEDHIVYSGVVAYRSGRVKAIVQIKTVGDIDYGGDYCEFIGGGWRQVGSCQIPMRMPEKSSSPARLVSIRLSAATIIASTINEDLLTMLANCNKTPNKITGANAGGPGHLAMWMRWAARVAQFRR